MTNTVKHLAIIAVIGLALSACQQYKLIEAAKPVTIADSYVIEPQRDWSESRWRDIQYWTHEGPLLHSIAIVPGVKDNHTFYGDEGEDGSLPVYKKNMTPIEIREWIGASLSRGEVFDLKYDAIKPQVFGSHSGYRMDYSYKQESGLKKRGIAAWAVINEELHLVKYEATDLHYFDAYAPTFEKMLASIKSVEKQAKKN